MFKNLLNYTKQIVKKQIDEFLVFLEKLIKLMYACYMKY